MWILTGEKDLEGEYTPNDSMDDYLDWFVQPTDDGGHGGPMIINHTNKVVGHWYKHDKGIHPETGQEAIFIEGIVHRGPDGKPFYNGDKLWNQVKDGVVKGTSWGGTIVAEERIMDNFGFQSEATNEKVQPYEISIVTDWDGQEHTPALPNATPILINENAKTIETEVSKMPDDAEPIADAKVKIEVEVVEETKEDTFDAQKAIDDLRVELLAKLDEMKGGAYPMSNADKKEDEEEDSEGKDDKKEETEEDDEEEDEEKAVEVFPEEWKETVQSEVKDAMKAFYDTIKKVDTPPPPQEQIKETPEKTKHLASMTSAERMEYFDKKAQEMK